MLGQWSLTSIEIDHKVCEGNKSWRQVPKLQEATTQIFWEKNKCTMVQAQGTKLKGSQEKG